MYSLYIDTDGSADYDNPVGNRAGEIFRIKGHLKKDEIADPTKTEVLFSVDRDSDGVITGAHYNIPMELNRTRTDGRATINGREIVNRQYVNDQYQRGWAYKMRHIDEQSDNSVNDWTEQVLQTIQPGECFQHLYQQEWFIFHPIPLADYVDDPRTVNGPLDIPTVLWDEEAQAKNGEKPGTGKFREALSEVSEPAQNLQPVLL